MTFENLYRNHPSVIASRIADSDAGLVDIPNESGDKSVSISNGFPAAYSTPYGEGGEPLKRHELNGILNLLSQLHFYWQAGGSPMWSQDVANTLGGYPKFARVFVSTDNGLVEYESVRDNNSVDPSNGNTAYWKEVASGGGSGGDLPEGVATETYVNNAISNALTTYPDNTALANQLSGYTPKSMLTGYAEKTYVQDQITAAITGGAGGVLSGYATKTMLSGYAPVDDVGELVACGMTFFNNVNSSSTNRVVGNVNNYIIRVGTLPYDRLYDLDIYLKPSGYNKTSPTIYGSVTVKRNVDFLSDFKLQSWGTVSATAHTNNSNYDMGQYFGTKVILGHTGGTSPDRSERELFIDVCHGGSLASDYYGTYLFYEIRVSRLMRIPAVAQAINRYGSLPTQGCEWVKTF